MLRVQAHLRHGATHGGLPALWAAVSTLGDRELVSFVTNLLTLVLGEAAYSVVDVSSAHERSQGGQFPYILPVKYG